MRKLGTVLLICSALTISACTTPAATVVEPVVAAEPTMSKL